MLLTTQYRPIEVFQGQKCVFQGHIQLQEMQQQQATALQSG